MVVIKVGFQRAITSKYLKWGGKIIQTCKEIQFNVLGIGDEVESLPCAATFVIEIRILQNIASL